MPQGVHERKIDDEDAQPMSLPTTSQGIEVQSLVDAYDQPFVLIDSGFRVVTVNRALEVAYGVERGSAPGRPCYQLVPPSHRPCPCSRQGSDCPFARVFAGEGSASVTRAFRDKRGREHQATIQAYPIRTAGGDTLVGELVQYASQRAGAGAANDPDAPAMIGSGPAFRQLMTGLSAAARSPAPVLLQGATGTGKELAAARIHRLSDRHTGPFQVLDCTTLTSGLFESEVFGHERGAFTGSAGEHRGLFEQADGGTLFIDEIGEMPLPLQAKLLRVLEDGGFRRVGGTRSRQADVRIIAATNRELLGAPWFRQDLYYRLACISLRLPTLAERSEDLPALAAELLARIGRSSGRVYTLDPQALGVLTSYDFPGNVRELRNVLWAAAANTEDGTIGVAQVAAALPRRQPATAADRMKPCLPDQCRAMAELRGLTVPTRARWEAAHLEAVLGRHGRNRRSAAQELGISERTLYRKIRLYGLE
jgi:two-component system, NtrC family, response regulator AtoC